VDFHVIRDLSMSSVSRGMIFGDVFGRVWVKVHLVFF